MPQTKPPYPPDFRQQMVELVRSGRTPEELAREFEPSAQAIRNWVVQAARDSGERSDGPTTAEGRGTAPSTAREPPVARRTRDSGKSHGLVRSGDHRGIERFFEFVEMNRAFHSVATMCRVLDVSPSGYYAWRRRGLSGREVRDRALVTAIRESHEASRETYGRPRIHADLAEAGWRVGGKRIARLMRAEGLRGVARPKGTVTTVGGDERRPHPDRVERDFTATAPDQLYVADITYIPTWSGFLYLAIVLDVFSRRIVGWRMETHLRTELVQGALDMALWQRRPAGAIHHSDQGCQYTSIDFGERCRQAGVRPSMGSVGDCYDNAMAENFFATLECELIDRCRFHNPDEARMSVFEFIEGWYNPHRRHSAIGYVSPIQYERQYAQATAMPKPETVH